MTATILAVRLVALTALLVPSSTFAQVVKVHVREEGTERQLGGAIVSLLGSGDTELFARFTNDSGLATLRAPARGEYRLIVRRIGYRPGRTHVTVNEPGTAELTLRLTPNAPIVTTVVVEADSSCGDIRAEGDNVYLLWENVRAALEANRLTESQQLVRMEIENYDRDLDRRMMERSKRVERKVAETSKPFSAASPADLESRGYVTTTNGESFYFAPEARTLLSDEFARSHCFFVERGGEAEKHLVGLAFRPKPDVSKPNIAGVLWLDANTSALRHLVFQYVNVPSPVRLEGVGGRLEFEQLPSGAWIIPRWYIRTPRLGRVTRYISTLSQAQTVDTLLGVRETGATARILGEHGLTAGGNVTPAIMPESHADKRTVPSDTFTPQQCTDLASPTGKNTVFGKVGDAVGNPVPQAKLLLFWALPEITRSGTSVIAGTRGQLIEVEPDERGNYAVCGLPTDVDYRVELSVAGRRLETRYVPAERNSRRIEIRFTVPEGQRIIAVAGVVTAAGVRDLPISDAEVILSQFRTRTDARGRFRLGGVPAGSHPIRIRRVGYTEHVGLVDLGSSKDSLFLIFDLRPSAPSLEPVRVEGSRAQPGIEGFHERKRYGLGNFLGRDELEKQRSSQFAEILGGMVGIRVVRLGSGQAAVASGRGNVGLSGRSKGGDASDRRRGAPSACYSQIFVDAVRVFAPNPGEPIFDVNTFMPDGVEGVEFYRSPAETPAQYSSPAAECGTLLIWTRRGDSKQ